MNPEDRESFRRAVAGELSRVWGDARAAGGENVDGTVIMTLVKICARQGWLSLESSGAADAMLDAVSAAGAAGCPLPLEHSFVAALLARSGGIDNLVRRIEVGSVRPWVVVGSACAAVGPVDLGPSVTHVLFVDATAATLHSVTSVVATPGLAAPSWSRLEVSPDAESSWVVAPGRVEAVTTLLRLALAVRAMAAVDRVHGLALMHAGERQAFGRPVGSFQAVSHRAVDGAIAVTAFRALVDDATGRWPDGEFGLAAELAVSAAQDAVSDVQLGAAHTLAAQGYFEEHEAPWLFRRAQADRMRLVALRQSGSVADRLLQGSRLPDLHVGDKAESFRHEVRAFLTDFLPARAVVGIDERDQRLVEAASAQGFLTLGWPVEAGGRDATVEEQVVFGEELAYSRVPLHEKGLADLFGPPLLRYGTPDQRARFLPMLAEGSLSAYLGYSEPDLGSDLASLRTRAVQDGDDWVVDGRKMWGTRAASAKHVWLAARTDPEASPPHAGITVFLTRVRGDDGQPLAGWEAQQHRALSGEVACSTFFDGFRVPDADRIGDVHDGWKVITAALAQERVLMANVAASIVRLLDDLLDVVGHDPVTFLGPSGSSLRARLSSAAARLQGARALVRMSVAATATGGGARLEAPMAKIVASLLYEEFTLLGLDILGPGAALDGSLDESVAGGAFEHGLRMSIMHVVGGGTVDVQRNLVARGLGLPPG